MFVRRANQLFLICLICLSLPACVGLAAGTIVKKEAVSVEFSLASERNQFLYHVRETPQSRYSKAGVLALWGKPDSFESHIDCKVLVYNDGTSWVGAGAYVGVLPVGVVLPKGKYKNRFYVRNGAVLGLTQEYAEVDRSVGYMCGSNACEWSAGEKANEPRIDPETAKKTWCN